MTFEEFIAGVLYASLWNYYGEEHRVATIWLQCTAEGRHEDAALFLSWFCV